MWRVATMRAWGAWGAWGVGRGGGGGGGVGGVYRSRRGACAAGRVRAASAGLATSLSFTRAVRSWPAGERLPRDSRASAPPQRLTFQTQRATTLQPQFTNCLSQGIALRLQYLMFVECSLNNLFWTLRVHNFVYLQN